MTRLIFSLGRAQNSGEWTRLDNQVAQRSPGKFRVFIEDAKTKPMIVLCLVASDQL
jgi:hypothetical protein